MSAQQPSVAIHMLVMIAHQPFITISILVIGSQQPTVTIYIYIYVSEDCTSAIHKDIDISHGFKSTIRDDIDISYDTLRSVTVTLLLSVIRSNRRYIFRIVLVYDQTYLTCFFSISHLFQPFNNFGDTVC